MVSPVQIDLNPRVAAQARRLRRLYDLVDDLVDRLRWQQALTKSMLEAFSRDLQRLRRKKDS